MNPGNVTITGSGESRVVTGLSAGTYTFTVTNAEGCTSDPTAGIVMNSPPDTPAAPVLGTITQPTCDVATGSVVLSSLPSTGTWTLTMQPGGTQTTGTGTSTTISGLASGTYTFSVTSASGCTSAASLNVVINSVSSTPQAPKPGTVTQPTCSSATGSVVLTGLPGGSWTLTRSPDGTTFTGSTSSYTVTGLNAGTYTFTVTRGGCTSGPSDQVVINAPPESPATPVPGTVTQPTCEVATGSVVLTGLPDNGGWTLIRNPGGVRIEGTGTSYTNSGLSAGTYTYRVINQAGCSSGTSSGVVINASPALTSPPVTRIDCRLGTGSAIVTVTNPVGTGIEYRLDQGAFQSSAEFTGVSNGSHVIVARNSAGCTAESASFTVSCGCVNGPSVNLSSRSGTACGTSPVTVNNNTFGGNATSVTVTEDGAGTVSPSSTTNSPFSFTYTPAAGDLGNVVTITFTTNNPAGDPCNPAIVTFSLTVNSVPSAPITGTVTQPTCTSSTGSVALSGLPSGSWIITRNPGSVSTTGNSTTTMIPGLEGGTYTFTVSNAAGCTSSPSSSVIINQQPPIPASPVAGTIVQPTCTVATGSAAINGLPASGTWTLTRFPGTVTSTGTGTSTTIQALTPGTYNFTVTGSGGCTSSPSGNVVINQPPPIPAAPVPGTITAPTCATPTGTLVLTRLPSPGTWTITSIPAGISLSGNGSTATISGIIPGVYTFRVTSEAGCISPVSSSVVIPPVPNAPVLTINNPAPLCAPSTVDLTAPAITAGSPEGLTYTYWTNQNTTSPYTTPTLATTGTYYIRGTNSALCSDVKPVTVIIRNTPVAVAGPDQVLDYAFTTTISANPLGEGETGIWSLLKGTAIIAKPSSASTTASNLEIGENILIWRVSNGVCLPSADTLKITVRDLVVPTLITPNNDGRNDYFILNGIENEPDNELVVFDRRGIIVFRDKRYHNDWNGIDYNGKPLADDTYFYIIKTRGKPRTGFVVIRR
jgi:gliding motility-associated-like protein